VLEGEKLVATEPIKRKLTTIVAADVEGYSRSMRANEEATLRTFSEFRDIIDALIARHEGRVFNTGGDSVLAEFGSAVEAMRCSISWQEEIANRNAGLDDDRKLMFRIGINVGDVMVKDGDLFGDGVNVAARLEGLADPGGICISRNVLDQIKNKVDVSFRNMGEQKLKNIPETVRAYRVVMSDKDEGAAAPERDEPLTPSDKPSIAVLPFDNMSSDPDQEYFTDGLVDDIITTLSKLSGLLVIARDSCFVFKGQKVDVRQIARELGVRYILEGSVRIVGKRVRINVQFTDAEIGTNIWAERYDRGISDIFTVQDEVTLALATEMQVQFMEGEQARLQYSTIHNLDAWSNWVKGLFFFRESVTVESMGQAREWWERAIALDPESASLNAMLGFLHCVAARFGWWDARQSEMLKSADYIKRAIGLDPNNAEAHRASGFLHMLQNSHDKAVAEMREAVRLAPNSADIVATASYVFSCSGLAEEAVMAIEKAMRLHPSHPPRYFGHLGNAYRLAGRFDEAIAAFKRYDELGPGFGLVDLVIVYKQLNRNEEAVSTATRLLAVRPRFTVRDWILTQLLSNATRLESEIDALTESGLPSG
jgi:adenylate cyclase